METVTQINKDEALLIRRLHERNEGAIDSLYDRYSDVLYGIILRVVKDEMTAMDVLQDSFVKIWQKADQYDPNKSKLFTWLLQVARNTAIDQLRSDKKSGEREIQMTDPIVNRIKEEGPDPDALDVQDHVKKLDPKYQEVIEALFFKGLTQQEASEYLDIPLGTVKTRLKIALRQLKDVFGVEQVSVVIALLMMS